MMRTERPRRPQPPVGPPGAPASRGWRGWRGWPSWRDGVLLGLGLVGALGLVAWLDDHTALDLPGWVVGAGTLVAGAAPVVVSRLAGAARPLARPEGRWQAALAVAGALAMAAGAGLVAVGAAGTGAPVASPVGAAGGGSVAVGAARSRGDGGGLVVAPGAGPVANPPEPLAGAAGGPWRRWRPSSRRRGKDSIYLGLATVVVAVILQLLRRRGRD